jgi:DNA-binding transcriptional ArsR family regulator
MEGGMRDLELTLKAVGDPTRARILKLLESGGLCVCQVQIVLRLAPSTISKHLTILRNAGLVVDKRDGKWTEYALARDAPNPYAGAVLGMLRGPLDRDPAVVADRERLREVKAVPLVDLCSVMPPRRAVPSRPAPRRAAPSRPAARRRQAPDRRTR